MKKLKYILIVFLSVFTLYSCDEFLDVNKDPDRSVSVTPEEELPVIVFYAAQINYDHAEYGTYLSQALTTGGKSQTGAYAYRSGWEFLTMNRHPQWRRHYYDLGVNINELIKGAEEEKSYNFILIARTIRLMSTQLTTDAFGDMPLSNAYTSIAPTYDTQEDVYKWMLKEADDLIALYNNASWTNASTNKTITTRMDRIYGGDLSKWKRFTHALKARILLRKLPNWENTAENCQLIVNEVDSALVSDWAEPKYTYDGGSGVKNCPWGSTQPIINGWESRSNDLDEAIPSKFLVKTMMGLFDSPNLFTIGYSEDPRLEKLMSPRSGPATDSNTKFRYIENNIGMGVSYKASHYPNLYSSVLTQNNSYVPLIMTEELKLIKSEALYWLGKKEDAYSAMQEAVNLNLTRVGVTSTKYINNFKNNAKYFPTLANFNIGHIMRHKYICMYLQPEQWTDMRRYKYSNSTNGVTYDGAVIYPGLKRPYNLYEPYWATEQAVAEQQWIQRLNYDPETEEKYNRDELERLGAYRNPEWLKVPMIWAK